MKKNTAFTVGVACDRLNKQKEMVEASTDMENLSIAVSALFSYFSFDPPTEE